MGASSLLSLPEQPEVVASLEQLPIPPDRAIPIPLGVEVWQKASTRILRLHYSADPAKGPAWVSTQRGKSSTLAAFNQEQEIDFLAYAGQRLFPNFLRSLNVVKCWQRGCTEPCPIPVNWTRYMAIDPHPRVPHAFLWMAVSPWGQHVYYREYWPSTVYGLAGDVPEADPLYAIDEYVDTLKLLEGETADFFAPGGWAHNSGQREKMFKRIMDPYGKAVAAQREDGKETTETFWDRYNTLGIYCEAAKKDFDAGRDVVNRRLRAANMVLGSQVEQTSVIQIMDTCPELILELETNRYPKLTPEQVAKQDPGAKPLPKRKHLTDLLRYIEITHPVFIERRTFENLPPIQQGVSY